MTDYIDKVYLDKKGSIRLKLEQVMLVAGKYSMDLTISTINGFPVDFYKNAFEFEMYSEIKDKGISRVPHEWIIEQ